MPSEDAVSDTAAIETAPLTQATQQFAVNTRGEGFADITHLLTGWLSGLRARDGLATLFIAHTSASLAIQENADPAVQRDLLAALRRLAPRDADYAHQSEGPDDMPAHIRAMLTSVSLSIPVVAGRMALGTWQGVFVIEHRARAHARRVTAHYVGSVGG
jgi:secondary thiamine-phosphate synthase enzyme